MPIPSPPDTACLLRAEGSGQWDTVLVAGTNPLDTTDTPIVLDCLSAPRAGLARSWGRDPSGRAWTLYLDEKVTSGELASMWRMRPDASAALRLSGVESLVPLDSGRLVVSFRLARDSLPLVFADPSLGLPRRDAPPARRLESSGRRWDLRDALDQGADLLETGDPDLLEYARHRADLTIVPLPWSRTYVLLQPAGGAGLERVIGSDTASFRAGLARDALRIEARGAVPPHWWEGDGHADECGQSAAAAASLPANLVAFPKDDPAARALAERIVSLAALPGLSAAGLDSAQFATALRGGTARAYVLGLPHRALVPCRERAAWPPGARVIALVETRLSAVLRRPHPELLIEWDGKLRTRPEP